MTFAPKHTAICSRSMLRLCCWFKLIAPNGIEEGGLVRMISIYSVKADPEASHTSK